MSDPLARQALPRKLRVELRRRLPAVPRRRNRVDVPRPEMPAGPVNRPDVTAAVILDDFSALALRYEWDQVAVDLSTWQETLRSRHVDVLFVESAWNGNGGAWRLAMTGEGAPSAALTELVGWCRQHGIPTVFWNKEDPPNYDAFLPTARLFDQVFTVDADRIEDYRRDLGHDRVALLPFGAQPRIHTPVRRGAGRVREIAFAGTYFADKHDERRDQMATLLEPALPFGLEIWSRMAGRDKRYQFPGTYARAVVGTLPYERLLGAYTSYRVFLNVNSVVGSPTMCARRLFELSAAQTAVLSAPSAAIEPFFGDTIRVSDTAEQTELELRALLQHPEYRDRLALRAHRRVLDAHRYEHRIATVLESVGLATTRRDCSVSAVVPSMRPEQVDHVLDFVAAQSHPQVELVLVTHGFEVDEQRVRARARELGLTAVVIAAPREWTLGTCMNAGVEAASGRYVAKMDDDNHYAEHFLGDLVRAFDYSEASVVGKWAHYAHLRSTGATLLRFPDAEHRYVDLVQGGTIVVARDLARQVRFEDLPRRVDTTFLEKVRRDGGRVYSADRFNFVSVRATTPDGHTWPVSDLELLARRGSLVFHGDPVDHVTV
ncbi:glycosyltransferase family protein [Humibacillus xanthopallidus]|uniref:Spore maturation protein CgeB n=1 Tax=Humibacillus xanthopallidus TaxID=412689 RepID=A0A543HG60_9MICO|nr:glycosyltransferase [Humibacillus xanthopallidus]TQM57324.1 spore maturation protein CgeB [Humibacillus xanthopallidus]